VILACIVLIQCQGVTDRHTDGQTDAFTIAKTWHSAYSMLLC